MGEFLGTYGWDILNIFNVIVLIYFLVLNLSYLALVIISFFHIKNQYKTLNVHDFSGVYKNELYHSYSIIVPAFNEEENIVERIRSLLQQQYGEFEIIVVNDGSTDDTLQNLIEAFDLYNSKHHISQELNHKPIRGRFASKVYPNLFVIDKENGHRADAMNAGINMARKDLFCTVDSDSRLEPDVLIKMLRSFALDEDTIAVGGIIRVANGCSFENDELTTISTPSSFISLVQVIEYIRSFLFGRTGWEYFNGLILISGAFGVFDRQAVINAGGYFKDAIGEDFELTVNLHEYYKNKDKPYNVTFQPEPVCWTHVPETWAELGGQRNRWHRGLFQTLWRFKKMMFNPRYGFVGMVAMPFYFIFELFGPVIEMLGYIVITVLLFLGILLPETGLLFFIVALLFSIVLSVTSLLCDELTYRQYPRAKDLVKLAVVSIFETFGYRQLHTWWRVKGMVAFFKGDMEWDRDYSNAGLVNKLSWVSFVAVNLIIIYLFYYGITY